MRSDGLVPTMARRRTLTFGRTTMWSIQLSAVSSEVSLSSVSDWQHVAP